MVRPDLEVVRPYGAVKAGPVEVIEGVVQFTDDRGHRRDPVVFVLQQADDARSHFVMRVKNMIVEFLSNHSAT